MSKEIEEKIRKTEREAKDIVEHAKKEGEVLIKNAVGEVADEKARLLKKLKRERNERVLRCELQWQKRREDEAERVKDVGEKAELKYKEFFEEAVSAAMKVILEDGDIKNL